MDLINLNRINLLFDEVEQSVLPTQTDALARIPLRYEQLVRWAVHEWQERYPDRDFVPVWAAVSCGNNLARSRIKAGRKLKGSARYTGYRPIECPSIVPINVFYMPARRAILTQSVGAFLFTFECKGHSVDVLFASAYRDEEEIDAIALVPSEYLHVWAAFEELCNRSVNRLEHAETVYVIGGTNASFKPTVDWSQVILSDALKADLRSDVETFFDQGVELYRQLGLPPFRKLLLVGPPGTGKTTLCAALAKLTLQRRCIVVYVSASDQQGASFDKIHRALSIVANSRQPVLLIVEEIDVYLHPGAKSQILNVLDGMETPNNPRGAMLLATTNYPEMIDERIAKRPGRIDRIIYVPPIQDRAQAERMLRRYMGEQWREEHNAIADKLIDRTGAFVREVALYARMLAANKQQPYISIDLLQQSLDSLANQLSAGDDMMPRKPIGLIARN